MPKKASKHKTDIVAEALRKAEAQIAEKVCKALTHKMFGETFVPYRYSFMSREQTVTTIHMLIARRVN